MPNNENGDRPSRGTGPEEQNKTPRAETDMPPVDPAARDDMAENAVRLDEIETLLHELSTEFSAIGETEAKPSARPETDTTETVRLPSAESFDLGKPVDYNLGPEQYDYRRASESHAEASITAQSMARKLAPTRGATGVPPRPDVHAGGSETTRSQEEQPGADEQRPTRRRLRLKPARRVVGSRPEPRAPVAYAERSSVEPARWEPRPRRPVGLSGQGLALGAVLTIALIGGATATFGFIEPLRAFLPDRVAVIFEPAAPSDAESANSDSETVLQAAVSTDEQTFQVAGQVAGQTASNPETTIADDPGVTSLDQPAAGNLGMQAAATAGNGGEDLDQRINDQVDKSADRISQDSVVQAILKDPEKRALRTTATETWVERGSDNAADPVVTGSIGDQAADGADTMAPVSRQAAATGGETESPEEGAPASVTIAGLGPNVPDGNASAYAPAAPDVQNSVPFPGSDLDISRQSTARIQLPGESDTGKTGSSQPLKGVDALLARGYIKLQNGQISSARLLFRRVAAMGDERGAKGMGMTFDPAVFAKLPVVGLTPDQKEADYWYRKAAELAAHKRIPGADATDVKSVSTN